MTLARKWEREGGEPRTYTCVCAPLHTHARVSVCVCVKHAVQGHLFSRSPPPPLNTHTHSEETRKLLPPPPPLRAEPIGWCARERAGGGAQQSQYRSERAGARSDLG
jgi:hypothetical protein